MARKQMFEGGTKNRIIEVGNRLFFEKGFAGTGIREIMKEVGADVGAFYYYYKSKDELFEDVLNNFFAPYEVDFEKIASEAEQRPYRALLRFFEYVKLSTREFRAKYDGHIHKTVRWAIREQTLTVLEPYIERIINILISYGGKPTMNAHTMAIFLSHGVGSVILHEESDWVDSTTDDMRKTVNLIMGLDEDVSKKMFDNSISEEDFKKMFPKINP
ncbi:MAG TPA: TetR/AcrR family transcriptional regulator [Oscillospiraceae bacterium]|nr:TetR/AcrR family transcriptional regulator [Oscillospiraceae bacterium]